MEDDLQYKRTSNGRRSPIEDDLKIIKVEYLSNHCINPYEFLGEIRGTLRGNLEGGSAQPSLFTPRFPDNLHTLNFHSGHIFTSNMFQLNRGLDDNPTGF
jgi:hypothetical protein